MTKQTKITVIVAAVLTLALVVTLAALSARSDGPVRDVASDLEPALVRDDSRVLGDPGESGVTFVEFLDFECEACGAVFPVVEELRAKYAGEVTFVARYFPLPGHFNAERAARAVESAARQGKFEEMYQKMYETQTTWAEKQVPADDVFRGFAEDLGLDMADYDSDYASDEVKKRVQRDVTDGESLGVGGTPTIYVDGELLQPQSAQDFVDALDAALAAAND